MQGILSKTQAVRMSGICVYAKSCIASEALYLYNAGHSQYDLARHCSVKPRLSECRAYVSM